MQTPFTLNPIAKFQANFRFACGCGKKAVRPANNSVKTTTVAPAGASRTAVAQTYQSGTMKRAPTAPVTRRTV